MSRADPWKPGLLGHICPWLDPCWVQCHHQLLWLDVTIFRGGGYPMEKAATLPRSHEIVVEKGEEKQPYVPALVSLTPSV